MKKEGNSKMNIKIFLMLLMCFVLASCGALRTFHEYARAGDTVAVPVGMKPTFNKDNITVTIIPASGSQIVLAPTDPAVRAIVNFYPDPISNMIVSREIGEDLTPFARTYATTALFMANNDKDYYQTTVFVDLPLSLPVGLTQIDVADNTGIIHSATLDVISGTGTQNSFKSDFDNGLLVDDKMLDSLARSPHTTVTFDAAVLPYAIELNLVHDPDNTVGGTGKAFVVNPLGYRKNIVWNDDGINMKIILTQSTEGIIDNLNDYKFYITGSVLNLQPVSVSGYDNSGNIVTGVTTTLTNSN
jgi:hypothetical protein